MCKRPATLGKSVWQSIMGQWTSRNVTEFVLCWPSTAVHGTWPKSGFIPSETLLVKINFFFVSSYLLETASKLGMEAYVHFRSWFWDHIWCRPIQALYMLPQPLWVHTFIVLAVFRRPYFLGVLHFSGSQSLPVSSSSGFPEPLGEGFDEEIPFRIECFKVSHALHNVWLWVSVLVLIYCRCEFSDGDWARHCATNIAEHHQKSFQRCVPLAEQQSLTCLVPES